MEAGDRPNVTFADVVLLALARLRRFNRWVGLTFGIAAAPLAIAAQWGNNGVLIDVLAGLSAALASGVLGSFLVRNVKYPPPARMALRVRYRTSQALRHALIFGVVGGVLVGLAGKLVYQLEYPYWMMLLTGLVLTLPLAVVIGLGVWLLVLVREDYASLESRSPRAAWRDDRVATMVSAPLFGALVGVPFSFVEVSTGVLWALIFIVILTTYTAWGRSVLAVTLLTRHDLLPWRLMRFLDDAHRLGVLRQVGPVYQFRHLELQARLAQSVDDA